jgi:uncharacterized membrane protein YeaQ/YmgE (transglycosylase-associated protein family)
LEHAFFQFNQPRQNTCIENYRYTTMQENTFPWVMKIIPAVVGALLALVLSGDIDKEGKIQVSMGVIGKFVASVTVSLYGGSAFIEHFEMLKTSTMYQGFIMLMFAVFGLLAIGILYQSIALLKGKPLPEVISEIKSAFVSIWGNGKGGSGRE